EPFATTEAQIDKFVVVSVEINGIPGRFIIDSGADAFIVSRRFANAAGLPEMGSTTIDTVVGRSVVPVRRIDDFRFANIHGTGIDAVVVDIGSFDGAIGVPLFRDAILQIDYLRRLVNVADASQFILEPQPEIPESALVAAPQFVLDSVVVDGIEVGPVRIDSGSSGGLHVGKNRGASVLATSVLSAPASFSATNGSLVGTAVIASQLQFASFALSDQFVLVQEPPLEEGLLGNLVLKQFRVGFDFTREQVLFELQDPVQYEIAKSLKYLGRRGARAFALRPVATNRL
ncbi:MAG: retropepsin-like domain-containing protein, partial [Bdellovibrionales bacterium]|nr:retropepsin-like domain-containing protein [Bdellovibrionales bacterium]